MQDVQSYNTAISRSGASAPLKLLESRGLITGDVLDYGSGKGADNKHLTKKGYSSTEYDPYWNPTDLTGLNFDTILCTYVLNVVSEETETDIISKIKDLLKPGGKAYLSVRRDIKKDGPTSRGFQRTVRLPYKVVKETGSFCVYEMQK